MPLVYSLSGLTFVQPGPVKGSGAPSASFTALLGQEYFDITTSPWTEC